MISNMATEVDLKRGEELFKVLINNEGQEAALLPYLEKYKSADGKEYTFRKVLAYIQKYLQSEYVPREYVHKYNALRQVPLSVYLKRGREICDMLIANNFNVPALSVLARKYADEDKRYLPYSESVMMQIRNTYLERADQEYLEKYNQASELAKRTTISDYNFNTLKELSSIESDEDILKYLDDYGLDYPKLITLRNAYFNVYPDDANMRKITDRAERILKDKMAMANKLKLSKANSLASAKKREERENKIKTVLRNYVNSEKDNFDECILAEGFNIKTFMGYLRNLNEEDQELMSLFKAYQEKVKSYDEINKKIVETLVDYYYNGVYYGYENRMFSLYDYYDLTDKSASEVCRLIKKFIPMGKGIKVINYINDLTITRKFYDRDEFIGQLRNKYKTIDKSEYNPILDYIEARGWPYSLTLFRDIWERVSDGLITLSLPQEKNDENMYKY